MTSAVAVAVVAPVYRNRATVPELTRRVLLAVPQAVLVLVDDACPDGSGAEVDRLAARDGRVVALHHRTNLGQQRAIRTGLAALAADAYVVLDADLQDPPEAMPLMLQRLRSGSFDAVFAGRRGAYESGLRRLTGVAHRRVLARAFGLPVDAGGFVAMSHRCAGRVLAMGGPPQLVAMIGRTGLATTSVPVRRAVRRDGRSTIGTHARIDHAAAALVHVALRGAQPAVPPGPRVPGGGDDLG